MYDLVTSIVAAIRAGGEFTVESTLQSIRYSLQFTTIPHYSSMKKGVVDCVGAATVGAKVFTDLFPEEIFLVAHVSNVPWTMDLDNDSKHCVVVRFSSTQDLVQILDPTPINGYGYGRTSVWMPVSWWSIEGDRYVPTSVITELEWDEYLYPGFEIICDSEIQKILGVSQMKYDASNGFALVDCGQPKSLGWAKDYYRILANVAEKEGRFTDAMGFYTQALVYCPNNPHLLRDLIKLGPHCYLGDEVMQCLEKKLNESTSTLVERHAKACKTWTKQLHSLKNKGEFIRYLYTAGCIFWREQSIALLRREKPEPIQEVCIESETIPLYRLLPKWFEESNFRVVVSKVIVAQSLANLPYKLREINRLALRVIDSIRIPDDGYVCIVRHSEVVKEDLSFGGVDAHKYLFALLEPRLIVI